MTNELSREMGDFSYLSAATHTLDVTIQNGQISLNIAPFKVLLPQPGSEVSSMT